MHKTPFDTTVTICALLFLLGISMIPDSAAWQIAEVDNTGDVGTYTSIALDAGGYPHISCHDETIGNEYLKYAYRDSTGWHSMVADNSADVGLFTSLALSAAKAHICYYRYRIDDGALQYVLIENGIAGTPVVVDDGGEENWAKGQYCSIALDSGGNPHISYYDNYSYRLWHVSALNGVWQTPEIVDDGGESEDDVGMYSSIAIDADDVIHISYQNYDQSSLQYATNRSGTWATEEVDGAVFPLGLYTSIALDGSGSPHICYYDEYNSSLKYAFQEGSAWRNEVVDTTDETGLYSDIAIDLNDEILHISYYNATTGKLRHASKKIGDAAWTTENVPDTGDNVGLYSSIAVDASGYVHISYHDKTRTSLKYATTRDWPLSTTTTTTTTSGGDDGGGGNGGSGDGSTTTVSGASTTTTTSIGGGDGSATTTSSTSIFSTTTSSAASDETTTTTTERRVPCPAENLYKTEDHPHLEALRSYRDNRLAASAAGRDLIRLYNLHAAEITAVLLARPEISSSALALVSEYAGSAASIGTAERIIISRKLYQRMLSLLESFQVSCSPQLHRELTGIVSRLTSGSLLHDLDIEIAEQ